MERARLVIVALATMILCGIIPGAPLVAFDPDADRLDEPAPLPPDTADRVGTARVTVRDLEGKPVPLATVRALFVPPGGAVFLAARAITGDDGVATLARLPVGAHWFLAEARGKARASAQRFVGADPIELELRLGAERPLLVEVRDDVGRLINGAELEITGADPLPRGARTGIDGLAKTTGVGDGPLKVIVRAPGFDDVTLSIGPGDSHVKAVLHKLGTLTVTVVDGTGKTVPGATVAIAGGPLAVPRTTPTGNDGTARISGLASGSYDLRATKGDLVAPVEIGIMVRRGTDATARLVLSAGRFVKVHVVDEDGRSLSNADVVAVEGGISPFPLQATTDAHGDARLGPAAASGPVALGARAPGFVARGPILVPAGTDEAIVEIVLRRAATLLGDVRDATGRPIDGATIEVVGTDLDGLPIDATPAAMVFQSALFARIAAGPKTLLPIGELGVVPGPVPPIPRAAFGLPGDVAANSAALSAIEPWVTRDDGSFRATPVPPGRLRAIVRHPAYVEGISEAVAVIPGGEATVHVVLAAGGRLEGTVKDDRGAPVEGAWVEVSARAGSLTRGVRTASDGSFVLAAVPAEISVTLAAPDKPYEPALRTEVSVPEGGVKQIELVLPSPREPSIVHVMDDRRYPVTAAQVTISSLDPASPIKATAFTDDRGEAEIRSVRGLRVQIEVRAPGHAPHRAIVPSIGATIDVELEEGILVKGVVYAPAGRTSLEGASVSLTYEGGVRRTTSDAEGRFSFSDVGRGDATIEVHAKGTAPIKKAVSVVPKGSIAEVDVGRLELLAAGTVEGEVVDEQGHPIAGARVARDRAPTYVPASGVQPGVALTDANGAFVLADVAVGEAEIEAFAADVGRGKSDKIRIDEGRTLTHVKIVLHPVVGAGPDELAPGGVAVTLAEADGKVTIAAVAGGSEAERAGLAEGDVIVSIDGVAVTTMAAARARLSGPLSEDVIVRVLRASGERDVRVPREATKH